MTSHTKVYRLTLGQLIFVCGHNWMNNQQIRILWHNSSFRDIYLLYEVDVGYTRDLLIYGDTITRAYADFAQYHRLCIVSSALIRCELILIGHMKSCTQWGITCSNLCCNSFDDLIQRWVLRDLKEILTPLEPGMTKLVVEQYNIFLWWMKILISLISDG